MSSYSKKKSCDFVVTAENTGKVLALSQHFLPDALYCFALKHFSNLLKKEDCTVGANVSKKSKKRQVGKHFRPNIKKQKPRRLKLRPLEPHEKEMAEAHHTLVLRFLRVNGLPMEDCGDLPVLVGGGEMVPPAGPLPVQLYVHRLGCYELRALPRVGKTAAPPPDREPGGTHPRL